MEPLYGVRFIVPTISGHTDVPMTLFREGGEPPFPIEDYLPAGFAKADASTQAYVRDAVAECFSRSEAEALVEYFREHWPTKGVHLYEKEPIGLNWIGTGAMAVGGNDDFYMFTEALKREGPPLPVPVWGYYDLCDAKAGSCVDNPCARLIDLRAGRHVDGTPVG